MAWAPRPRQDPNDRSLRRETAEGWWELMPILTTTGLEWVLWAPRQVRLQSEHPEARLSFGCITKDEALVQADTLIDARTTT